MELIITAQELIDKGLWQRACDMLDLNQWAVNEGTMESTHILTFTNEQAKRLGLI